MWQYWVRRGLLAVSLICVAFLAYTVATRPDLGSSQRVSGAPALKAAHAGGEGFTFTQSHDGRVEWEVQAEHARLFEHDHRAVLERVRITLYGKTDWALRLEGEKGTIDTQTYDFELSNGGQPLTVEFEGGYTVYTRTLGWTEARREVYTTDVVTIVGNGIEVRGRGLNARVDANEFQVQHDVRVDLAS